MVRKLIRKVLLGTASVLALGIGGAALDIAVNGSNPVNAATMPSAAQTSDNALTDSAFRKDDIRRSQVALRFQGLYKGSIACRQIVSAPAEAIWADKPLKKYVRGGGVDSRRGTDPSASAT